MITKEEVKKIAKLARIGLTDEEAEKMQKDFSAILDYFDRLNNLDVSRVEPLFHSVEEFLEEKKIMRQDKERGNEKEEPSASSMPQKLINLAPDEKKGFLKVKAIFK